MTARWDEYLGKAETALDRAITKVAKMIEERAKELTSAHRSPPPSMQGQPPHMVTGTLTNAITSWTTKEGGNFIGHVGVRDGFPEYAFYLEVGWTPPKPRRPRGDLADGRPKVKPPHMRPYLRPAMKAFEGTFFEEISKSFIRVTLR